MSNMDRTCKAGWCPIANIAPIMSIICKSLIRLIKHSYCQPPALWPIEDMLECLSMPTPLTSSHPISRWSCGWCSWRGKWSGRGPLPETVAPMGAWPFCGSAFRCWSLDVLQRVNQEKREIKRNGWVLNDYIYYIILSPLQLGGRCWTPRSSRGPLGQVQKKSLLNQPLLSRLGC